MLKFFLELEFFNLCQLLIVFLINVLFYLFARKRFLLLHQDMAYKALRILEFSQKVKEETRSREYRGQLLSSRMKNNVDREIQREINTFVSNTNKHLNSELEEYKKLYARTFGESKR